MKGAESSGGIVDLKRAASERQIAEAGSEIAGPNKSPFRDAQRVADQYGGEASDWAKMTSTDFRAPDGTHFQTHWVENLKTGERVEFKTKFQGDSSVIGPKR